MPKPDRGSLEDALRATLQALDSGADLGVEPDVPSTAPAAPTRGRPLPSRQAPAPAADARGGGRQTPGKESLQNALRATLSALEAERKAAPPGSRPLLGTPLRASPPARRKKKLSVKGALGIVVLLAAAVGAGYGLRELGQPPAETIVARPAPRVRIAANERAAVGQVMAVLRDVQSVSRTDVSYRVYFNRVSFAKGDVERSLANVKEADLRAALNDAMSVHVFAANVWRAKTLNEREKWEAVGEDPSVELCPGAKRILAIGDEPANMSRAQWRGIALAAGLPLLWDCAAERLAEVERGLSK
ncbi:MAG: hypothetical protein HYU41_25735 [Candidatus Rokubacteria bacterium]|nr:hypothetical protein [Candidatus Rokubacteria bacterium]